MSAPVDNEMDIRQGEIQDVEAQITFLTAATLTEVKCTLRDNANRVAGGIEDEAGEFLNSSNGVGASTDWIVWFPDFDPTTLELQNGDYYMELLSKRGDGEKFKPRVKITLTD